jgi:hypothetical protein
VVPVAVTAVAPVVVTVIVDITEWVVKEQMHHNNNINTNIERQIRNRININIGRRRDLGLRININIKTNINIGKNPGHRISPISLAYHIPIPEEWSNSIPIIGCHT